MSPDRFRDRAQAGRLLAERLREYAGRDDVVVLGLPRGGVPVAFEVARALGAPLDVFLVRKLGVPGHEELAFGAIATGGTRVLNEEVVESLGIPLEWIEAIDAKERRELERQDRAYPGERPPPDLAGRTVILVDDGLAAGSAVLAARRAAREDDPARAAVAVEADWPDAWRVNRFVHAANDDDDAEEALSDFRRFPVWMWRNVEVAGLVGWMREHNDALPAGAPKAGFYGLDLYSLHTSM